MPSNAVKILVRNTQLQALARSQHPAEHVGLFVTTAWSGQAYTASIPALALEHADISDPSSVPVRLAARSGRVQAASVQDALAAASAGSSAGDAGAALGAPASSRRLQIWQVLACRPLPVCLWPADGFCSLSSFPGSGPFAVSMEHGGRARLRFPVARQVSSMIFTQGGAWSQMLMRTLGETCETLMCMRCGARSWCVMHGA